MKEFIRKHFDLVGYILLFVFFVFLNYQLYINMDLLIDSDMASEMIYAKLLHDEGVLISSSWFFSTVIEVVEIPLLFAPLFAITNSWHTVRIIGVVILGILLFLSFYYLCKQLNIKHIPWLAFLILGSISFDYFYYVIRGSYYVPYIIFAFITVGLIIDISKKKRFGLKIIILGIISLLSGLTGIRQVVQCYLCVFGASILLTIISQYKNLINKYIDLNDISIKITKASLISFSSSFVGFLINKVLLEPKYGFNSAFEIELVFPSANRMLDTIYGLVTIFGYKTGNIITAIFAVVLMLITLYACVLCLKNTKNGVYTSWIVLLFACSSIITVLIFNLTTMAFASRYFLIAVVFVPFTIGACINDDSNKSIIICFLIAMLSIGFTYTQFKQNLNNLDNKELITIKEKLIEVNSIEGYASFWNGNIMTELSDGKIETWTFHNLDTLNNGNGEVDIFDLYEWLQKKEHFERKPNGKPFVILTKNQNSKLEFKSNIQDYILFNGENYIVYVFDTFEELFECFNM